MHHTPSLFIATAGARRVALLTSCFVGLAACAASSGDAGAPAQSSTSTPGVAFDPTPAARSIGTPSPASFQSGNVTYHGGPVISNVRVTVIYWTSAVAFQGTWPSFYATEANSTYLDWLTEYHTSTQGIGRGSFVTAITDPGPPAGTTVTQSQIETELQRLIQIGAISTPGSNDLYMVYFPPGFTVFAGGWVSCSPSDGFCGYHSTFPISGGNGYYGVIIDSSACGSRCGPGTQLDNTTSTSSHELLEAITDPLGTNAASTGWYDNSDRGEISDICQDLQVQVAGFTVQKAWSQLQQACVARNPCLSCPSGTSCRCGDFICRTTNSQCP